MTESFHRTNINFYSTDVEWLKQAYGYGWTTKVREIIHGYITALEEPAKHWGPTFSMTFDQWRKWNRGELE